MKKIISFMLLLIFAVQPFYVNATTIEEPITYTINELDYFLMLRNTSDEDLLKNGLTTEQIEYIRQFDLVEEVKNRAELSNSQLKSIGYSTSDISDIREFTQIDNLTEEQVINSLSLATLTLTLNKPTTSTSFYNYNFSFVWSKCPIFLFKDLIAATWAATGSNGSPVNVAINKTKSYLTTTNATTGGAPAIPNDTHSWIMNNEYSSASLKFSMGYNLGDGMSYWTKSGNGQLRIDAVVPGTIYEMYLKLGYGHTIAVGIPSATFTGSGASIGFKFSIIVNEEAAISRRYRHNGVQVS
jgi:hypothetical protein